MLVARCNLHRQHQPQIAHHVAVIAVRRAAGLVRIVAHHGTFLMPVERLHRGVDIENPRLAQKRPRGVIKMPLQPRHAGAFLDLVEAAPHGVFAHHFLHSQQRWIDRVAAQRRHVRVTPMPGQHRQHHRAEYIALGGRVRAHVMQRAIRHEAVEQSALLEVLDEERQLPERRHRRPAVPFHMDAPSKSIGHHRPGRHPLHHRLLTRPEPRQIPAFLAHTS